MAQDRFQNIKGTQEAHEAYPDLETVTEYFTVQEIVAALWQQERGRRYRKEKYLRDQLVMERLRAKHPDLFASLRSK